MSALSSQHPTPRQGNSVPISNDRGHLLNGIPRSNASPWGTFKGTWDSGLECTKTFHSQTLAPLKSEGASCLNNQVKKANNVKQSDMTVANKKQDKIFKDFSKMRPDRSDSPLSSPHGVKDTQLAEVQQGIQIANHDHPVAAHSPIENKISTPQKANAIASPVAGSPKPETPHTPTLEDKPAAPVEHTSPLPPLEDTNRKSLSPLVD